jgi:hypothetical protein
LGQGLGNGASRASYIVAGEYLESQPRYIPATPSPFYDKYLHQLMKKRGEGYVGGITNKSAVNTPFSEYLSLITEAGIIGFLILIFLNLFLLYSILRSKLTVFVLPISFLFILLFMENWAGFPNWGLLYWFTIIFWTAELNHTKPFAVIPNTAVSNHFQRYYA